MTALPIMANVLHEKPKPAPKPAPTCPCGSTNVQIGGKTADGKTACRCRVCGFPWAEVLS